MKTLEIKNNVFYVLNTPILNIRSGSLSDYILNTIIYLKGEFTTSQIVDNVIDLEDPINLHVLIHNINKKCKDKFGEKIFVFKLDKYQLNNFYTEDNIFTIKIPNNLKEEFISKYKKYIISKG